MKKRILVLALMAGSAQAQIYRCVDASGHKEYTDSRKGSHCVLLDVPGAIAAPAARSAPPKVRPQVPAAASQFPRIDNAEQKARDADRRAILTEELNAEMKKLAELKVEFNNGEPERRGDERNYARYQERVAALRDNISRSEKNVEALRREIANIR